MTAPRLSATGELIELRDHLSEAAKLFRDGQITAGMLVVYHGDMLVRHWQYEQTRDACPRCQDEDA
jgi:hypothetical protein